MVMPLPSSMTGGAGGSAGPSSALGSSSFDSSGWNVNFGGGSISSNRATDSLGAYTPYMLAAVALLIVWRLTKK